MSACLPVCFRPASDFAGISPESSRCPREHDMVVLVISGISKVDPKSDSLFVPGAVEINPRTVINFTGVRIVAAI